MFQIDIFLVKLLHAITVTIRHKLRLYATTHNTQQQQEQQQQWRWCQTNEKSTHSFTFICLFILVLYLFSFRLSFRQCRSFQCEIHAHCTHNKDHSYIKMSTAFPKLKWKISFAGCLASRPHTPFSRFHVIFTVFFKICWRIFAESLRWKWRQMNFLSTKRIHLSGKIAESERKRKESDRGRAGKNKRQQNLWNGMQMQISRQNWEN